jgi:hypothetical protein
MRRRALSSIFAALVFTAIFALICAIAATAQTPRRDNSISGNDTITLPAGTKVELALTSPVWAKSVKLGADVYSLTAFPVAINNQIAIPAGTYAQGTIDAMTMPSWRSAHAAFQMHFTKLVFANGYTVELPAGTSSTPGTAIVMAYVNVSSSSDILLDNGSQIELVLQSPLSLSAGMAAGAARASKPVQLAQFKSATRCRPTPGTPGTPGTPDTVIPGSPGTPDTVIPGSLGMPDTVIPGSPATPPTIIPGSPGTSGTPGTTCPGPPIISGTPSDKDAHKQSFQVKSPIQVAGQNLPAGSYKVSWVGLGPIAAVDILQKGKVVIHTQAQVVTQSNKASKDDVNLSTNANASFSMNTMQFKGSTLELIFGK